MVGHTLNNLFSWPIVGAPLKRLLGWRYARLLFQIPLLILALLALWDGFTGSQIAARNVATVSVWLHYRGILVLALCLIGNLFCAACPLMLTRGFSRWLSTYLPQYRVPRAWRNKYGVLALTVLYFWAYEYWDLWSSPWLTAWLIVGYFASALIVDALFPAGTFCKYVCPLGQFNFALAQVSPSQIAAVDPAVCQSCTGKYCLNGRNVEPDVMQFNLMSDLNNLPSLPMVSPTTSAASKPYFPGCETQLYVPQIQSNRDCTLCFNCVRACPHDNVALHIRLPHSESKPKLDFVLFGLVLWLAGLFNAWAMTPSYFAMAQQMSEWLNTRNEGLLLALLMLGSIGLGALGTLAVAFWASRLGGYADSVQQAMRRWGVVVFPLSFAMWAGHYSFHFLTGWASIIPVLQQRLGLNANWLLAGSIPENTLFPLQVCILYVGFSVGLWWLVRQLWPDRQRGAWAALWPWVLWLSLLTVLGLWILAQPMEMRGTLLL